MNSELAPVPAAWFQNGFHRFLDSYLKRHFHAIAVARDDAGARRTTGTAICGDMAVPMIVYCNHPSWWDPMIAHFINHRLLAPRQLYAPIDAIALEKYKVLSKLGFFGVDLNSSRGAADFLKTTGELLQRPATALWLTPEGRFADARDHDAALMPGLAHLCSKLDRGLVVPLALEYAFWDERLPVCLLRIGELFSLGESPSRTKSQWTIELAHRLRENQTKLAALAIARAAEPFDNLLHGKQGASGAYDWARRLKSWLSLKRFDAAHGDKFGGRSSE
ncbi:lysophospholipid acyltransferase family protein [Allorhodopirellula heiligendammensis]|uniref:Phospholipid/glycerol acyltransferase domain-containing protein n=1 Tax=Allorhodopirellula heiligendammensis TaxID=2714739 RepID=A0A5C6BVC4_9BACT|nr:lysophospholipid acyltransferase family protein [Allorhodopirellula heiligendammensis]TWU15597.1 hypothetical protein Poly21_27940 [Allorhodopirellula heiligendammensis]